jgi:hypothetical protein
MLIYKSILIAAERTPAQSGNNLIEERRKALTKSQN